MSTILLPYVIDLAFFIGWAVMFMSALAGGAWLIVKITHTFIVHAGLCNDFWSWRGQRIKEKRIAKEASK